MPFKDRRQAGELLAGKLTSYRGLSPLILAVPRGGISVAEPIWNTLGGTVDLMITRKVGAPLQPELALGAVAGEGYVLLNEPLIARLRVSHAYLERAVKKEQTEVQRRLAAYRGGRVLPDPHGKLVILVDDGVATGFTLLAALRALSCRKPKELVVALPVGPPETLSMLQAEVDHLYFLEAPSHFEAVGQFYTDFSQVEDDTVISILKRIWHNS